MRTCILLLLMVLSHTPGMAQQMSWFWQTQYFYPSGTQIRTNGWVASAAFLDSSIVLSCEEDTTRPTLGRPKLRSFRILSKNSGRELSYIQHQCSFNYGENMLRLSDTSFVVFTNYESTEFGGPLYALNAKAYGVSGVLLWTHTFGLDGSRSYYLHGNSVAGGGFDIIVNEPDPILPSQRYTRYYRFDARGNIVDGPFNLTGWPQGGIYGVQLRPNRLGYLSPKEYRTTQGSYMLVYRADARLQQQRIDTIPYGADSLHAGADVIPTGDDGFLYYAFGPAPGFGLPASHNYFYLARYDADGRFLWGGRRKHMRLDFDMLADGGMLVLARQDTGFRSGSPRGQILTFSRINADSSIQWARPFFAVGDTSLTGKIAFDGRDGGIFYGQKGVSNLGGWPWVGYITNLGRPLDPTPVQRPVFTGLPGGLQVYPNPARSGGRLRYRLPAGSRGGAFTLLAPDGRLVADGTLAAPEGELTVPAGLASGLYLLRGAGLACRVAVE